MKIDQAIAALCNEGVEFLVIGGVAAVLHGSAAVTFDLDILYRRTEANVRRLIASLAPFHPRLRGLPKVLPFVWDAATLRNSSIITLETDLGDIDLLTEIARRQSYDDIKARAIEIHAHGHDFWILSLRDLIASKRATGRPKDLLMLPELEGLLEAQEDESES